MELIFNDDRVRYETISRYGEWQAKEAGFWWDKGVKRWWTTDIEKAAKLEAYATGALATRLREYRTNIETEKQKAREASRATDSDVEIPAPEGLEYLPYQKAGIRYAMTRKATIIGDEMGLGKTIQAIGVINADDSIRKVLVICPASLRLNWKRELEKW